MNNMSFFSFSFFLIGRWTSPLSEPAKNPLFEHSEDSPAGQEDA